MRKVKVIITDYIEPDLNWEKEQFKKLNVDFSCFQLKLAKPNELLKYVSDAEILIVNMAKIDADVINGLNNCKLIIRHGIGYDNVDVKAATKKNIVVANIPDYCVNEVAEQAVMLIFACQRKIMIQNSVLLESSKKGQWDFRRVYPVFSIKGKTMGIIGCGRIGSTVYQMMQGFGLRFMIVDQYLTEDRKQELGIEKTYSIEETLEKSDIISIHVPLNKETYHLIDENEISLMKRTAILINTARGGIVNLRVLDEALRNGKLSHAGIDVYEENEPPKMGFPLLHNERAIVTPHLSWLSEEAGWNIRKKIVEDVRRYLSNEKPRFVVS